MLRTSTCVASRVHGWFDQLGVQQLGSEIPWGTAASGGGGQAGGAIGSGTTGGTGVRSVAARRVASSVLPACGGRIGWLDWCRRRRIWRNRRRHRWNGFLPSGLVLYSYAGLCWRGPAEPKRPVRLSYLRAESRWGCHEGRWRPRLPAYCELVDCGIERPCSSGYVRSTDPCGCPICAPVDGGSSDAGKPDAPVICNVMCR